MPRRRTTHYGNIQTPEGRISFGELTIGNEKLAVSIRNNISGKATDHHYELVGEGKFAGSTRSRAPGSYQILCGREPVDGVSFVTYAENGDLLIGAPKGRIRIWAKDIDFIASGDSTSTGNISLNSTSNINLDSNQVNITGKSLVNVYSSKGISIQTAGNLKLVGAIKFLEPDDTTLVPPGNQTIRDTLEGIRKLIGDIAGG